VLVRVCKNSVSWERDAPGEGAGRPWQAASPCWSGCARTLSPGREAHLERVQAARGRRHHRVGQGVHELCLLGERRTWRGCRPPVAGGITVLVRVCKNVAPSTASSPARWAAAAASPSHLEAGTQHSKRIPMRSFKLNRDLNRVLSNSTGVSKGPLEIHRRGLTLAARARAAAGWTGSRRAVPAAGRAEGEREGEAGEAGKAGEADEAGGAAGRLWGRVRVQMPARWNARRRRQGAGAGRRGSWGGACRSRRRRPPPA
jgi:hypothetical protein